MPQNLKAQKAKKPASPPKSTSNPIAASTSGPAVIKLLNPSFEDLPSTGRQPREWSNCGDPRETAPDVQPGSWQVQQTAFHGKTYLGMVVRDVDTWEKVGQRLTAPLVGGKCYKFSIYLCKSAQYISQSQLKKIQDNYIKPIKLRIWGGDVICQAKELLGESSSVTNTRWIKYDFLFKPKRSLSYIVLEAFYVTPVLEPYNGNLLLDNASDIIEVPSCNEKLPDIATIKQPDKTKVTEPPIVKPKDKPKDKVATAPTITNTNPQPNITKSEPKILVDLDKKKIKQGQIIRIDKLYFLADTATITVSSYPVLDEVFNFLTENQDVAIEIGGHTNGIPEDAYCDKLSTERAKAVYDYLIKKGIQKERLYYKGYGKRNPVATNSTAEGRKKSQRVELKILSVSPQQRSG